MVQPLQDVILEACLPERGRVCAWLALHANDRLPEGILDATSAELTTGLSTLYLRFRLRLTQDASTRSWFLLLLDYDEPSDWRWTLAKNRRAKDLVVSGSVDVFIRMSFG